MHFTSEFRRRLMRLNTTIQWLLIQDYKQFGFFSHRNLFPHLFSVYSFIWCNDKSKLFKK